MDNNNIEDRRGHIRGTQLLVQENPKNMTSYQVERARVHSVLKGLQRTT